MNKAQSPIAEVFGFSLQNQTTKSERYRKQKLCPFNNKVPNCTKDKANNPLGVCSVHHKEKAIITCPVRSREDWLIVENAAKFFFKANSNWTSLTEIRLQEGTGQSAGNIDYVLVEYDENGKLIDFASLEVQGVYISGNLRNPFDAYVSSPSPNFSWLTGYNYPKPDFLSSSRKRLVPQILFKGGIFKSWKKKQGLVLQKSFFDTLPALPQTSPEKADMAWFLYDLEYSEKSQSYNLVLVETVYTEFEAALLKIITPVPSDIQKFTTLLQDRLDDKLEGNSPDAPSLNDIIIA